MGGLRGIDMFRKIPADLTSATTTGAILSVAEAHEAAHHYVKVVSTHFDVGSFLSSLSADASTAVGYQTLVQTQTMAYHELDVPEAEFSYDRGGAVYQTGPT